MTPAGTSRRRREDEPLITGRGSYVADLVTPDTLHASFVRSPVAHGTVGAVDTSAAAAAPGVVAVYTAADLDLPDIPTSLLGGKEIPGVERPILARDRVRYVGEAIAMVVAEGAAAAVDATELVWPDIDFLDPVVTFDDAITDRTLLFPDLESNVVDRYQLVEGTEPDPELDLVDVTVDVAHPRLAPAPIEPLAVLATATDSGLRVWVGHQAPHELRRHLATLLGIDEGEIRVTVPDVGGAFGTKRLYPEYPAVAKAALLLDRPVAWIQPRREMFSGGNHGRSQRHTVTLSADREGRVHRARFQLSNNPGAYPHSGGRISLFTRLVGPGLYAIPRVEYNTTVAVSNRAPTGPYRGAGRPEAAMAIERAMDALATRLDLDPAELRRRNFVQSFPYRTPTNALYDSGDYEAVLDLALAAVEYEALRKEQAERRAAGDQPLGIGIGGFVERSGGAIDSGEYGAVELLHDGTIEIRTGSTAAGQGHTTVWTGIAAAVFEVPQETISVVSGDTALVEEGVGSFASRSASMGGGAVQRCAVELREAARSIAADMLEAGVEDVVLDSGAFHVAGVPDVAVDLPAVAAHAKEIGVHLESKELFVPGAQTFPYGIHIAVVEVELETGSVLLRRLVTVDDVGTVLDPMIIEGQHHGAMMQGLGAALFEEMRYDESGQPLTATFMDYLVPQAHTDLHLTSLRIESPAPSNPLGAKGAGEGGCIGAPPAILNATLDALRPYGVTDLDIPLHPNKVWTALQAAGAMRAAR